MVNGPTRLPAEPLRIGTAPFFNALPLTFGLDERPDVILRRLPPAQLAAALDADRLDAALVPAIDYQRADDQWTILQAGAIGSQGPVLTVQVFSRWPLDCVATLAVDTDSHTSVALAQIIWCLRYCRPLQINLLDTQAPLPDAVMLIGDKVLAQDGQWPYQLDLGAAWHELTRLPFVYAFWVVRHRRHGERVTAILQEARRQGMRRLDSIIDRHGLAHGFNYQLARAYFTENICYDMGPEQKRGLEKLNQLAHDLGLTCNLRKLFLPDKDPHAAIGAM